MAANASNPEPSPRTSPCTMKGRRIMPGLAPTNCMFRIKKRRANTVRRMVLLSSAKATSKHTTQTAASAGNHASKVSWMLCKSPSFHTTSATPGTTSNLDAAWAKVAGWAWSGRTTTSMTGGSGTYPRNSTKDSPSSCSSWAAAAAGSRYDACATAESAVTARRAPSIWAWLNSR